MAVGVTDDGIREVPTVGAAVGERSERWRGMLLGLTERGPRGERLEIADDHESIKSAVQLEPPDAARQRCAFHLQRNVLAHVPETEAGALGSDPASAEARGKVVFQARRRETAKTPAAAYSERCGTQNPKAVASPPKGLGEALAYLVFPASHHRLNRRTNGVERVFAEVKRRTRVVGVSPNEQSAERLATAVLLRVSVDWAERRYLAMAPLHAPFHLPTGLAT